MLLSRKIIVSLALLSFSLPAMAGDALEERKEKGIKDSAVFAQPLETVEIDLPWGYHFKRWIWENISKFAFSQASDEDFYVPAPSEKGSELVSWQDYDSTLPFDNLFTAEQAPSDEDSLTLKLGFKFLGFLRSVFPSTASDLPQIPDDREELAKLFPEKYQPYISALSMPQELVEGALKHDVLGATALKGLGAYIAKDPKSDGYIIDLSSYNQYSVKNGLSPLGGKAYLKYNKEIGQMETQSIEYSAGPGSEPTIYRKKASLEEWDHKQRIMLATMSVDIAVVRHLLNAHMIIAGTFCAVNNLYLGDKHPLRILMRPHQHKTILANNSEIPLLLGKEDSIFPVIYSYSRSDLLNLVKKQTQDFKIQSKDIEENLKERGMIEVMDKKELHSVVYPYAENTLRLKKIVDTHVEQYLDIYYKDEKDGVADRRKLVKTDLEINAWFNALDSHIPNGIRGYTPVLDKINLKKLISLFIYTASVEHEIVGNNWVNYHVWQNLVPTQTPADIKKRPTVDILHQTFDVAFGTSAPSVKIMGDFSYLAEDEAGKQSFKDFHKALLDYQQELEAKGDNAYTIFPSRLEAGTSA